MRYETVPGRITPFHEDEAGYIFRFFCDRDMSAPHEQSFPKSRPHYVCGCRDRISVEVDSDGPYLRFWSRPDGHFAAKERSS